MATTGLRWLDRLRHRWRSLISARRLDRELDEELAFHLTSLVEAYQRQGLSLTEATRRARLEMGGTSQVAEATRDVRGWLWLDRLVRDSRLAFRVFARYPGFTATAVLTIALGMGANTALFTLMHGLLFRPLPIADPDRAWNVYFTIENTNQRSGFGSSSYVSFVEYQFMRSQASTADVAGIAPIEMSFRGGTTASVSAQMVSDNLLSLIGARPVLGRFFHPAETATPGGDPVVVLTHAFWRRALARDPDIIGKTVSLNRTTFTVIGVADSANRGPLIQAADLWVPLTMQRITRPGEPIVDDPTAGWIQVFARNRLGNSEAAMRAELMGLGPRAVASHDTAARTAVTVAKASFINTPRMRNDAVPVIGLIWIAALLILVVACANVANMLLARGLSRRREIAIRLAVGADRRRVIGQLLTESAWLGALGGGLGLLIAHALGLLVPGLVPEGFTIQLALAPDGAVLAFTALGSLAAGLVFGLLPAIQTTGLNLSGGLKSEGLHGGSRPRLGTQGILVGLQVAASVVLLVVAGLLVKSLRNAVTMDVGRPLDHLLVTGFDLRQQQYQPDAATGFVRRVVERMNASPAVVAAGATILDPELASANNRIALGDSSEGGERVEVAFDEVDAGFFAASGLRLVAGRPFTQTEVRSNTPVMVIDQQFADRHFGGRAVGKSLWLGGGQDRRRHEIVGVVGNVRPIGIGSRVMPTYYIPMAGLRYLEAKILVRYRGDPAPVAAEIRRVVESNDDQVTARVRPIEDNVREALTPLRVLTASLAALGGLALMLASIGLFGVIAFSVGRRSREIAVRMALGATAGQVVRLICGQGARPVIVGLLAGLALAAAAGVLIRGTLLGVSPIDPFAMLGVAALVALGAAIAFVVPARRVVAVRPAQLLRVD